MNMLAGRWNRKQFNLSILGAALFLIVLVQVLNFFGQFGQMPGIEIYLLILMVGVNVGLVLISILRLHDLNLSGWWCLVGFVPYINLAFYLLLMIYPSAKGTYRFSGGPVE